MTACSSQQARPTPTTALTTTPSATATPTATASPTPTATVTPTETPVRPPAVEVPFEVKNLDPDGKIYKVEGNNLLNADGTIAYTKDEQGKWQLVRLRYGNWQAVTHPETISMAATRCITENSPCAKKRTLPLYGNIPGYQVDTVSLGALERVPFIDPNTKKVIGTSDQVMVKTKDPNGNDVVFGFQVQILNSRDKIRSTINDSNALQLINYLETGYYLNSDYNIKTPQQLVTIFAPGAEMDMVMLDSLSGKKVRSMHSIVLELYFDRFYANPTYLKNLKNFLALVTGTGAEPFDPNTIFFTWGGWSKGFKDD